MIKKQHVKPLSLRLKLLLAFFYILCLGAAFSTGVSIYEISAGGLFELPESVSLYLAIANAASAILYAWVIYNFHQRKKLTALSFVIADVGTVGLASGTSSVYLTPETIPLTIFLTSLLGTLVSIGVILFLFLNKESISQLNK